MSKIMKKIIFKFILVAMIGLGFAACEDVIDVDLDEGTPQITVDALISDSDETPHVKLTLSGQYFDAASVRPITDATLSLTDSEGNMYGFDEPDSEGRYYLTNGISNVTAGNTFTLQVDYNNEQYIAESTVRDIPLIDSISWAREKVPFGDVDSIWAVQFWATDLEGLGDAYWVRPMREGVVNNDPGKIVIGYDGSTGRGSKIDGIPFILPIRAAITPGGFAGPPSDEELAEVGDEIGVQLYSISLEFAEFLTIMSEQLNNGGLFAETPANLPTNVINQDENGRNGLGWFYVGKMKTDSGVISWEKSNNKQ